MTPNTQTVPTLKEMDAVTWQALTDADRLAIMELALMQLAGGAAKANVRHAEYWLAFHPGNAATLQKEVQRLRSMVTPRHGFTVRPQGLPVAAVYPPNSSNWRYR